MKVIIFIMKQIKYQIKSIIKRIFFKTNNFPQKIVLNDLAGKELYFNAYSPVENYRIALYGNEKDFLEKFISELNSQDILFDIGASVGLMTVHAASVLKDGKVFAFEPDPENRNRLRNNVNLNYLTNVEFIDWAVSDSLGEVVLFTDGAAGAAPTLREQKNRDIAPKGQVLVKTKTLDQAIIDKELPLPTVLKIDIEGAEILCIKGANKLLQGKLGKKPRLICVEIHPDFLPDFSSDEAEIHNLILTSGYSVVWHQEREAQIHYFYQSNS